MSWQASFALGGALSMSSTAIVSKLLAERLEVHYLSNPDPQLRFALLTAPHDPANLAMFLFAAVFMDTAATIPTGAIDGIVVTLTGLPDHEAEGLGGSIELTPRTAVNIDKPFLDHASALRMTRAAELLKDYSIPIKTIASLCGYTVVNNFYRDFKLVHGTTPCKCA